MQKEGFTLIEMTVVVGILSIILLVISGAFGGVLRYQRISKQSDNVRDNMQFVLNVIDKELRTSSELSVNTTTNTLSLKDQFGDNITYSLQGNTLRKTTATTTSDITDPNVFLVDTVRFNINNRDNPTFPLVTIILVGKSLDGTETVTMQSTTMPRNK